MPSDDNNNSSGGGWVGIAKGVGWALIPGTGLVDAYGDVKKGNYGSAALNVALEIPIAKVFKAGKAVKAGIKGAEAVEAAAKVEKGLGKLAKEAKIKPEACLGCGALKEAEEKAAKEAKETASKKAATLKQNRENGLRRESEVVEELRKEGKEILGEQVSVKTSKTMRRVDVIIRDGNEIRAIEVKSGNATRSSSQIAKDNAMATEGGTIIGKNAPPDLRGQIVTMSTEVRK